MPLYQNLSLNDGNKNKLSSIFKNEDLYNSIFLEEDKKKLFMSNEKKNFLYGRVDTKNNTLILNNDFVREVGINNNYIKLCDVAATAFADFLKYMEKAKKVINKKGNYYNLNPIIGFHPVHTEYVKYLDLFYQSFVSLIDTKYNKKIKDAKSFFEIFIDFSTFFLYTDKVPLTRTGYINTSFCKPLSSGLMIDLSNDDVNDDQKKYDNWIKDLNFEFFCETATKFNFLVDIERPWRLVFDLNAENLFSEDPIIDCGESLREKGYMKLFNINSLQEFFDTRYYKSMVGRSYIETTELQTLKIIFTQMYNTFIIPNREIVTGKDTDKKDIELILTTRDALYVEDLEKLFNDEHWLRTLLYIRALETSKKWNQTEFEQYYSKSISIYKNQSIRHSIDFINEITKAVDIEAVRLVDRKQAINVKFSEPERFKF